MKTQSKKPAQRGKNRVLTSTYTYMPSIMEDKSFPPWLDIMIECNRQALYAASKTSRECLSEYSNHLRAKIAIKNCFNPPSGTSRPMINPDITQTSSGFDR